MTLLQRALITVTLVAAIGTGIYTVRQSSRLRQENQALQQQQATLTEQMQQLQQERDQALKRLAAASAKPTPRLPVGRQVTTDGLLGQSDLLLSPRQEICGLEGSRRLELGPVNRLSGFDGPLGRRDCHEVPPAATMGFCDGRRTRSRGWREAGPSQRKPPKAIC